MVELSLASDLQWLTPAEIRRPAFPRWTLVPAGFALLVCMVGKIGGLDTVLSCGRVLAVLAAPPMAWWFEERIFGQLGNRAPVTKVFALVVVFNGPLDQVDHAERAVRYALALQAEVAQINAEGVLPEIGALRIGVGIATGPMVCGNVGGPTQMEYTVIGETVNLSARLTSMAGPGEVWVSEATAKAAPSFTYTLLPEVKLKGKEKSVAPLRAEGAVTP